MTQTFQAELGIEIADLARTMVRLDRQIEFLHRRDPAEADRLTGLREDICHRRSLLMRERWWWQWLTGDPLVPRHRRSA